MNFRIRRSGKKLIAEYLNFGKWYKTPKKYHFEQHIEALLQFAKNPDLKKYDITITNCGIVSVDNDRQLSATP